MKILSQAGLPRTPWSGQAVLLFRRTAWFSNGKAPLIGLLAAGLSPSPAGLELAGDLPRLRPGGRLESDGQSWFLEGIGQLTDLENLPDNAAHLRKRLTQTPTRQWRQSWVDWFEEQLSSTAEGRWLAGLIEGPGSTWEKLIGRGSGSTPLGDDYLAGWLAARQVCGQFAAADYDRLIANLGHTAVLSRHFLWHLAHGRVHCQIAEFLEADNPPLPESAWATRLANQGDLSGRATLVGLVAALAGGC